MRALAPLFLFAFVLAGCVHRDEPETLSAPATTAAYVGDEACGSCHGDLYASYHATGMGRSVSRFDAATAPEQFGPDGRGARVCAEATGYCYQALVRGDTLFHEETRPDTPGYRRTHAVSHVVGSGNATRSYFMTVADGGEEPGPDGGYLTEMPLTWYVERGIWDLSPGYEQSNSRFERPISLECLTCHDGTPSFAEASQNFFFDIPLGITCERCHGPGGAHVEARLEGGEADGADPTIVNPARLDAARQLAVCQQCHLTGVTVFAEGDDATTYRPGALLSSHRRIFAAEEQVNDPEAFGIASHALRMMKSACFEETQGTGHALTCTTCHDPHVSNASLGADHFNATCRSCHDSGTTSTSSEADVCARPSVSAAEAMTGDCVGCHMPRGGTSDIPHVTFTDHWIRRTIPPARPPEAIERGATRTTPFTLVDVTAREQALVGTIPQDGDAALADVEAGIAYWVLFETEHRLPDYLPRIVERIRRGFDGGAHRADGYLALGGALREQNDLAGAESAFAEGVRRWPSNARLLYALGEVRLRRGKAAAATEVLAQSVAAQPRLTEARLKLAEALDAAGRPEEAEGAYRAALRQNPEHHAEGWNNLGFLLLRQGRHEQAAEALARAVALRPTFVEARANFGAAQLAGGDLDGAAEQFEAALRYAPDYVPALGNLAVIRAQRGDPAEARRLLRRVLALDPNDRQAAAYLQQLGPS